MYASYRQGYNCMETNKENLSFIENHGPNNNMFSTPSKNRAALDVLLENGLATPCAFGDRTNGQFQSLEDCPIHELTQSKVPQGVSELGEHPQVMLVRQEDLPGLKEGVTMQEIMQVIKTSFSGKSHKNTFDKFQSINLLRTLNKHYPDEIREIFNQFGDEILQSFTSEFVIIQKNIIMFVYETFTTPRNIQLDQCIVGKLIPLLIDRAASKFKEVRDFAKHALNYVARSLICNESLLVLCAQSITNTKKKEHCLISFQSLAISIRELGDNVSKIEERALKGIFVTLSKTIMHAVPGIFDLTRQLLFYLCGLMGFENMVRLLKGLIEEGHIKQTEANKLVEEISKGHSKQFLDKSSRFREMLKETKAVQVPRSPESFPVEIKLDKLVQMSLEQQQFGQNGMVAQAANQQMMFQGGAGANFTQWR